MPGGDADQRSLRDNALVIRGDGADRLSYTTTGVNPALSAPSEKPAPPIDCPSQYANTGAWVHRFTP